MEWADSLHRIVVMAVPLIFAITLHEAAHAYAAYALGDPTARSQGRVSLDPVRHIDLMGTILLPGLLLLSGTPLVIGWAKPVPVDLRQFKNPRRDMALVALAGPASNAFQALVAAILLHFVIGSDSMVSKWAFDILRSTIMLNCVLAAFNMLPLPPLDGSRLVLWALPSALVPPFVRLERYGMLILLALMVVPAVIGSQINPLWSVLRPLVNGLVQFILIVTGLV